MRDLVPQTSTGGTRSRRRLRRQRLCSTWVLVKSCLRLAVNIDMAKIFSFSWIITQAQAVRLKYFRIVSAKADAMRGCSGGGDSG